MSEEEIPTTSPTVEEPSSDVVKNIEDNGMEEKTEEGIMTSTSLVLDESMGAGNLEEMKTKMENLGLIKLQLGAGGQKDDFSLQIADGDATKDILQGVAGLFKTQNDKNDKILHKIGDVSKDMNTALGKVDNRFDLLEIEVKSFDQLCDKMADNIEVRLHDVQYQLENLSHNIIGYKEEHEDLHKLPQVSPKKGDSSSNAFFNNSNENNSNENNSNSNNSNSNNSNNNSNENSSNSNEENSNNNEENSGGDDGVIDEETLLPVKKEKLKLDLENDYLNVRGLNVPADARNAKINWNIGKSKISIDNAKIKNKIGVLRSKSFKGMAVNERISNLESNFFNEMERMQATFDAKLEEQSKLYEKKFSYFEEMLTERKNEILENKQAIADTNVELKKTDDKLDETTALLDGTRTQMKDNKDELVKSIDITNEEIKNSSKELEERLVESNKALDNKCEEMKSATSKKVLKIKEDIEELRGLLGNLSADFKSSQDDSGSDLEDRVRKIETEIDEIPKIQSDLSEHIVKWENYQIEHLQQRVNTLNNNILDSINSVENIMGDINRVLDIDNAESEMGIEKSAFVKLLENEPKFRYLRQKLGSLDTEGLCEGIEFTLLNQGMKFIEETPNFEPMTGELEGAQTSLSELLSKVQAAWETISRYDNSVAQGWNDALNRPSIVHNAPSMNGFENAPSMNAFPSPQAPIVVEAPAPAPAPAPVVLPKRPKTPPQVTKPIQLTPIAKDPEDSKPLIERIVEGVPPELMDQLVRLEEAVQKKASNIDVNALQDILQEQINQWAVNNDKLVNEIQALHGVDADINTYILGIEQRLTQLPPQLNMKLENYVQQMLSVYMQKMELLEAGQQRLSNSPSSSSPASRPPIIIQQPTPQERPRSAEPNVDYQDFYVPPQQQQQQFAPVQQIQQIIQGGENKVVNNHTVEQINTTQIISQGLSAGDAERIKNLDLDMKTLAIKIKDLFNNKVDHDTMNSMLRDKATKGELDVKAEKTMVLEVEEILKSFTDDLELLRDGGNNNMGQIKSEMEKLLKKQLSSYFAKPKGDTDSAGTLAAVKKLMCLSCARPANRVQLGDYASAKRTLLPKLSNQASHSWNNDVFRGGFRMPAKTYGPGFLRAPGFGFGYAFNNNDRSSSREENIVGGQDSMYGNNNNNVMRCSTAPVPGGRQFNNLRKSCLKEPSTPEKYNNHNNTPVWLSAQGVRMSILAGRGRSKRNNYDKVAQITRQVERMNKKQIRQMGR